MVSIWLRSDNFAHGFVIAPISAWLIWQKRAEVSRHSPQGAWLPVLLMLPVCVVWLLGNLAGALVVQQFALVAMLILGVWAVVGTPLARLLAFPLGFLFFAVPVGDGLVYPMMTFTADFTVSLLRATGIPVYREGTFFSIPSGDWSVVEACSGVRYLTASVTLGVLYAYLTYTRLWKRLLFVAFAIAVAVIGNGMRAYLIVMLGHLSDMTIATGVDHLIYGWVFFGFLIFVMFFVGSFWRDAWEQTGSDQPEGPVVGPWRGAIVGAVALAVSAIGPVLAWATAQGSGGEGIAGLQAPALGERWTPTEANLWDWRPNVVGADGQVYQFYRGPVGPVGLYIGVYGSQREGAELVNWQNQMVLERHPVWSEKGRVDRSVAGPDRPIVVEQHELSRRTGERLLVWNWYRVGGWEGTNPYLAKIMEVWQRIAAGRSDGAMIAVAAPYGESADAAAAALKEFVVGALPGTREAIDQAVGRR
jgi:exosortase A